MFLASLDLIDYYSYNEQNKLLSHCNSYNNNQEEYAYDKNGNKIYSSITFDGYRYDTRYYEYDNNGIILIRDENKVVIKSFKYDKNGNCIYDKELFSEDLIDENWYRYDDKGNLIYRKLKSSYGDRAQTMKQWYIYDIGSNVLWHKFSDGVIDDVIDVYKYDDNGNLIYCKDSVGEKRYTYDKNGNKIRYKDSSLGYEEEYEYIQIKTNDFI